MKLLHKVPSYWLKDSKKKSYPKLIESLKVDILIVGGGITGILTAYQLAKENKYQIALVDKNLLYHSTTGYTTGKITFQHQDIYHRLISSKGIQLAKKYYLANQTALNQIKKIIQENNIDCDFEETDSYLYALKSNPNEYYNLQKERAAYDKLQIPYEWIEEPILPLDTKAYLKVPNQAVFHIVKFLDAILDLIPNVKIYENTNIISTKEQKTNLVAYTSKGNTIHAKHIILASHYPIYKVFNFFFTIIKPSVSYAIVANSFQNFSNGAYINLKDPILSFRLIPDEKPKLLVAGFSHSAHQLKDYEAQLKYLEETIAQYFKTSDFSDAWYNQDYQSIDYVPLIGRIKKSKIYLATGFNKWGITTAFVASNLFHDLIVRKHNDYINLFNPNRSFITLKTIGYNMKVGYTYIHTKVLRVPRSIIIPPNTGRIIKIGTKKVGVYVDENGKTHSVIPICPHMGCTLRFNPVNKTYDCPCHGSRFNYDGECFDGPSRYDLKKP